MKIAADNFYQYSGAVNLYSVEERDKLPLQFVIQNNVYLKYGRTVGIDGYDSLDAVQRLCSDIRNLLPRSPRTIL